MSGLRDCSNSGRSSMLSAPLRQSFYLLRHLQPLDQGGTSKEAKVV